MYKPPIYIEDGLLVIPRYEEKVTEDGLGNIWSREDIEVSRKLYKVDKKGLFILQKEECTLQERKEREEEENK